jgi:hypothetical protein
MTGPPPLSLNDARMQQLPTQHLNFRQVKINALVQRYVPPVALCKGAQLIGDSIGKKLWPDGPTYTDHGFTHVGLTFGGMTTEEFDYLTRYLAPQQVASHVIVHVGIVDIARYRPPQLIVNDLITGIHNLLQHNHVRYVLLCTVPNPPQFQQGSDVRHKLIKLVNHEINFRLDITDHRLQIIKYENLFSDYRGSNRQPVRRFFVETFPGGDPDLLHLTEEGTQILDELIRKYKREFCPYLNIGQQYEQIAQQYGNLHQQDEEPDVFYDAGYDVEQEEGEYHEDQPEEFEEGELEGEELLGAVGGCDQ